MQPSTPNVVDSENRAIAFGRTAVAALAITNGLGLVLYLVGILASLSWLSAGMFWFVLLEGMFFLLFFMPALVYRILVRKEQPKLAASRALEVFVDALGLA